MPELPEIETVRTVLAKELVGKRVKTAALTAGKVVRRHKSTKAFRDKVENHTIKAVQRLGTNLIFLLDDGNHLVIDVAASGQLQVSKTGKDAKPKHTLVVFTMQQGGELRFVDPKGDGELYVSDRPVDGETVALNRFVEKLAISEEGKELRRHVRELAGLGLDPVVDQFGWDRLGVAMQVAKLPVKTLLTNSAVISGVGSLYADETLFTAGIRFDRSSETLSTIEARRLHRALVETLSEAVKYNGTSLGATPFADPDGTAGTYQQYLKVVGRAGAACEQCRTPIQVTNFEGQETFYCERCQV